MEAIIVVGVETVAGANLAAMLCDRLQVVGVHREDAPVRLDPSIRCEARTSIDPHVLIRQCRPAAIVHCGPAAVGLWERLHSGTLPLFNDHDAAVWAAAAAANETPFVLVSSDGVFSGPWMFHSERSACWCSSPEAAAIRRTEQAVLERCPFALIVRTHVVGWSPQRPDQRVGWFEGLLADLEHGDPAPVPFSHHATPIAAPEFANLLEVVLRRKTSGVVHIAGAQRVNFREFAMTVAEVFGLPSPRATRSSELTARPTGFGHGETALDCRRLRRWGLAVPVLRDSLLALRDQRDSGFLQRLGHVELADRVA